MKSTAVITIISREKQSGDQVKHASVQCYHSLLSILDSTPASPRDGNSAVPISTHRQRGGVEYIAGHELHARGHELLCRRLAVAGLPQHGHHLKAHCSWQGPVGPVRIVLLSLEAGDRGVNLRFVAKSFATSEPGAGVKLVLGQTFRQKHPFCVPERLTERANVSLCR
jgi:hypothetical protein